MFFVYILQSEKDKSYYIGSTNNVQNRLLRHNNGYSFYTKRKRPWKLLYKEEYNTLIEARRRERKIKSWKKRAAIEKLIDKAAFVADSNI